MTTIKHSNLQRTTVLPPSDSKPKATGKISNTQFLSQTSEQVIYPTFKSPLSYSDNGMIKNLNLNGSISASNLPSSSKLLTHLLLKGELIKGLNEAVITDACAAAAKNKTGNPYVPLQKAVAGLANLAEKYPNSNELLQVASFSSAVIALFAECWSQIVIQADKTGITSEDLNAFLSSIVNGSTAQAQASQNYTQAAQTRSIAQTIADMSASIAQMQSTVSSDSSSNLFSWLEGSVIALVTAAVGGLLLLCPFTAPFGVMLIAAGVADFAEDSISSVGTAISISDLQAQVENYASQFSSTVTMGNFAEAIESISNGLSADAEHFSKVMAGLHAVCTVITFAINLALVVGTGGASAALETGLGRFCLALVAIPTLGGMVSQVASLVGDIQALAASPTTEATAGASAQVVAQDASSWTSVGTGLASLVLYLTENSNKTNSQLETTIVNGVGMILDLAISYLSMAVIGRAGGGGFENVDTGELAAGEDPLAGDDPVANPLAVGRAGNGSAALNGPANDPNAPNNPNAQLAPAAENGILAKIGSSLKRCQEMLKVAIKKQGEDPQKVIKLMIWQNRLNVINTTLGVLTNDVQYFSSNAQLVSQAGTNEITIAQAQQSQSVSDANLVNNINNNQIALNNTLIKEINQYSGNLTNNYLHNVDTQVKTLEKLIGSLGF